MEARQLTVWEAKERDGLIALETDEWRKKRLIAEDQNTSATALKRFSHEVSEAVKAWRIRLMDVRSDVRSDPRMEAEDCQALLLAKAIAAHTNTPLDTLSFLLNLPSAFNSTDAFCQNPTAPFVVLEKPDFWEYLRNDDHDQVVYERLLSEESLPLPIIAAIDQCYIHHTGESARHYNSLCRPSLFHVLVAGEIQTENEGRKALTKFWKNYCKTYAVKQRENYNDYYHKALVEVGLAPAWAVVDAEKANLSTRDRISFFAVHQSAQASASGVLSVLAQKPFRYTDFARFVVNLQGVFDAEELYDWNQKGEMIDWMPRLDAALKLPLSSKPFNKDQWNRSPLDLLNHLARDGNRFVRWAAQTRLADPNFVFTWHEDAE